MGRLLPPVVELTPSRLRVVTAILFVPRGAQKRFGLFGGEVREARSRFWTLERRGERPALYRVVLLFPAAMGGGRSSVDGWFRKWWEESA